MELVKVLIAAVLTVPAGIVIADLVRKGRILQKRDLIEQAKRAGRVATARKLWEKFLVGDPCSEHADRQESCYMAQYLYFAEGRQYAFGARNRADPQAPRWSDRPPDELTVYWPPKRPERAISDPLERSGLDGVFSTAAMLAVFLFLCHVL